MVSLLIMSNYPGGQVAPPGPALIAATATRPRTAKQRREVFVSPQPDQQVGLADFPCQEGSRGRPDSAPASAIFAARLPAVPPGSQDQFREAVNTQEACPTVRLTIHSSRAGLLAPPWSRVSQLRANLVRHLCSWQGGHRETQLILTSRRPAYRSDECFPDRRSVAVYWTSWKVSMLPTLPHTY